jgi:hypothetical protein
MTKANRIEHENDSAKLGFYAKIKALGWFTKGFLIISLLGISGTLFLMFLVHYFDTKPEGDSYYVEILEEYAGESLPSCKVKHKVHFKSGKGAIYSLDEYDFKKVLTGVQSYNGSLKKWIGMPARDFF